MDFVRKRKVNLPLGVLGAVLLASLLYLYVFLFVVHIEASRNYISYVIGFVGVVFFATMPIVLIYKYMLRVVPERKVLSIDESGIRIYVGDGIELTWDEIRSVQKVEVGDNRRMTLSISLKEGDGKPAGDRTRGKILYFPGTYGAEGDVSILFEGISPDLDNAIREVHRHFSGEIREIVH